MMLKPNDMSIYKCHPANPFTPMALLGMKETKCDKILRKNVLKKRAISSFLRSF